jgi:hypothetical protein
MAAHSKASIDAAAMQRAVADAISQLRRSGEKVETGIVASRLVIVII